MKKLRKKSSKRGTLKQRYRIIKRVKQYHKKMRKQARKMGGVNGKGKKPEAGIPNSYPFKNEEIDREQHEKLMEEIEKKKRKGKKMEFEGDEAIEELKNIKILKEKAPKKKKPQEVPVKSKKDFFKELQEVISTSRILLLILDARDPLSCRLPEIEAKAKAEDKQIVLILNKVDLLPKTNSNQWKDRLMREYPTYFFSCNQKWLTEKKIDNKLALAVLKKLGKMQLPEGNNKIGLIGYPNVGKLCVLSELLKYSSELEFHEHTGTVFAPTKTNEIILKNIKDPSHLADPYVFVHSLLKRVSKETFLLLYEVADFHNTQVFLANVAQSLGLILKGGIPDYEEAAKRVLSDWVSGKIMHHEEVPFEDTEEKPKKMKD